MHTSSKAFDTEKLLGVLLILGLAAFLLTASEFTGRVINLTSPENWNVTNYTNVTFSCNVTDDGNVYNISLYTNINGSFNQYDTKRIMELDKDSNTSLLCRFDNTYTCEDGETGIADSTSFNDSRFVKGVLINDSDTLHYPVAGNIAYDKGTIEFWVRPGVDPSSNYIWYFSLGSSGTNEVLIRSTNNSCCGVDKTCMIFEMRDY